MRHAKRPLFVAALCLFAAAALASPTARGDPAKPPQVQPRIGSIDTSTDAARLAALLAGPGVTIGNARLIGDVLAAGTFVNAQADVGIANGVILSTGRVTDIAGPNQFDATSTDFAMPGDADLDSLIAPLLTQDAVILEFDVTPTSDTIAVSYVFGTEEHAEFVGSPFADVVAIFVNGVNCANVGGLPVSVNSINAGINANLFVDNRLGARSTELDGLTRPLECVAAANPGMVNRVRIAIADTANGVYDSAVFVAAGGIRSPGGSSLTTSALRKVIEYYHHDFDHYFITSSPDEITKLDNGTFVGWERTGRAFNVFVSGTPGTVDVCRFFSTAFAPKSSHFYTPSAPECAGLKSSDSWQFEDTVFNMALPDAAVACPPATRPLYRLYNDGQGGAPNHRYTTELDIFDSMRELGWIPEGSGIGVIGCVPL
ncbi:MAG: choice-of-anchor L domain-containing protein [Burkholderiales bacterium]|nr:choice-of-anchor L domain-containing protein [Burkholderiales bacterium]